METSLIAQRYFSGIIAKQNYHVIGFLCFFRIDMVASGICEHKIIRISHQEILKLRVDSTLMARRSRICACNKVISFFKVNMGGVQFI